MTDDIRQAFAHPEERAAAIANGPVADRLSLRDYIVSADIGAFQQERGQAQRLRFNIVVEIAPQGAAGDDVDRILSYDTLTGAIGAELAAERLNLLETLAEKIAARILTEPQPRRVFVRVEKLDRGPGALGVEIVRDRLDAAPVPEAAATVPLVVFLANDAMAADGLPAEVEDLMTGGLPLVLTVDAPQTARPAAATEAAQRRIALLAVEQNAWALAARDPRLNVVATRTELDWAIRNRQCVVWAPSKMICDTPDAPLDKAGNGIELSVWLAGLLGAAELRVHGSVSLPAGSRVPVRRG
ncbi:MAG: dihydroneopterin aldolase [Rhodobacteraceae bacterium]|nr:dihydroneopterin aldolase [Paracoccaceae bacterium]